MIAYSVQRYKIEQMIYWYVKYYNQFLINVQVDISFNMSSGVKSAELIKQFKVSCKGHPFTPFTLIA